MTTDVKIKVTIEDCEVTTKFKNLTIEFSLDEMEQIIQNIVCESMRQPNVPPTPFAPPTPFPND